MKLEQDVCNGSKRKQIYKCDWLWQTGYYAKTKQKGGRGMREGWIEKRFDEVFTLQMGKTPDRKNKAFFEGTNTWVSIKDLGDKYILSSHECISDEAATNISIVKKGTVIMSFKLTVGKCAIAAKDLYTNEAIMAFNTKDGYEINSSFLYYYFKGYKWNGANKAVMGLTLNKATISKHNLFIPPLSTQQSIVSELDKINELIRLKKEQLKDYDNLAQSIFYEMFGDEKYERRKLKDIVKVKSGQVSPLEDPYCDMVHVGPANIESNTGRLINLKTAKEENLISGKYLFDSSMVLYSKIRPNLNKVTIADFEGICSADMYPLIPSKSIDKKFLLFILKQKEFLSYAIANSGRANIPKINREALLEYSTILPPLSLQLQFAERLALIEKQKEQISSIIKDLETLLASRMQYWFD